MTTPYDEVEYPGFPYADTHPDRLATLATLFGMSPPSVATCRVLELGCGDGANLVPVALGLPGSACLGIDLADRAIERARACARALDLANVTFRCGDIAALDPDLGQFDYVIAHGVYSWVPSDVRDRLLAACKRHLAPQGVAFVSYNAHPGGHLREMTRGMMAFQARAVGPEPARQVSEGLAFLKWIADSAPSDDVRRMVRSELDLLAKRDPLAVYHDELAPAYAPVYFYEFVDHAARHGLQYLSDAEFSTMQSSRFPSPLAETLHGIGDVLVKEQLQDFLRLRRFRESLVCHADIALDRAIDPARVRSLWVASAARPEPAAAGHGTDDGEEVFRSAEGSTMSTNDPLAKAALHCLTEAWPRAMAFADLAAMAAARLPAEVAARRHGPGLEQRLLAAYGGEFVELHVRPPAFTLEVSARPLASPLARWQLRGGVNVTTLRHAAIKIEDALLRQLILLLDGARDHPALHRELATFVRTGEGRLERGGRAITDGEEIAQVLARELPEALAGVGRLALLLR